MIRFSKLCALLVFALLLLYNGTILATPSTVSANAFSLTGYVLKVPGYDNFYAIIGDDGKRYQPTNLPRQYKKDGTVLRFNAVLKDNIPSAIHWGTIVNLSNVTTITPALSHEERSAIWVLQQRMDAFNNKSLAKLQQIDTVSKQLTQQQFDNWIGGYSNFKLKYIDISYTDYDSISGTCYYTRELVNGMTLDGNIHLAAMNFTLRRTAAGWKLTNSTPYTDNLLYKVDDPLAYLNQMAQKKYGTDNLTILWR